MRLINADKLKEAIEEEKDDNDYMCRLCLESIKEIIDKQPTAFDVDKAISELERDKFIESECILSDVHQGYNAGLSRAIEIVKGGGVDD